MIERMTSNLTYWISHPEALNRDTLYQLRTLLARYPYSQSLRLLFLKNLYLLHDGSFGKELRKSVLYVGDRRMLFYLIEGDKYSQETLAPLEPGEAAPREVPDIKEEPGMDRTLMLIDSFLAARPEDEATETNELQYLTDYTLLPAPPAPADYLLHTDPEHPDADAPAETTEEEKEVPLLRGQDLIDNFIEKAESEPMLIKPSEPDEPDEAEHEAEMEQLFATDEEDDTYFTETLAKIYIKQHRYEKAHEIIKKLSLKYPKKNVYFADQIRFLEKLIINAKSK